MTVDPSDRAEPMIVILAEPEPGRTPGRPVDAARAFHAARRRRAALFPDASLIFLDPAWDLLLDLYIADAEGTTPAFETLCANAGVQPPTALRWITTLEKLLLVEAIPGEGRRPPTLRLAPRGSAAMHAYLSEF